MSEFFRVIEIRGADARRGPGNDFLLHASIGYGDDVADVDRLNRLLAGHKSAVSATIGERVFTVNDGVAR